MDRVFPTWCVQLTNFFVHWLFPGNHDMMHQVKQESNSSQLDYSWEPQSYSNFSNPDEYTSEEDPDEEPEKPVVVQRRTGKRGRPPSTTSKAAAKRKGKHLSSNIDHKFHIKRSLPKTFDVNNFFFNFLQKRATENCGSSSVTCWKSPSTALVSSVGRTTTKASSALSAVKRLPSSGEKGGKIMLWTTRSWAVQWGEFRAIL